MQNGLEVSQNPMVVLEPQLFGQWEMRKSRRLEKQVVHRRVRGKIKNRARGRKSECSINTFANQWSNKEGFDCGMGEMKKEEKLKFIWRLDLGKWGSSLPSCTCHGGVQLFIYRSTSSLQTHRAQNLTRSFFYQLDFENHQRVQTLNFFFFA